MKRLAYILSGCAIVASIYYFCTYQIAELMAFGIIIGLELERNQE